MLFNEGLTSLGDRVVLYGDRLSRIRQGHHFPFTTLAQEHQVLGRLAVIVIMEHLQTKPTSETPDSSQKG